MLTPPQIRGKTNILKLTPEQAVAAREFGALKKRTEEYEPLFTEVADRISSTQGAHTTAVLDDRLEKLREWARRPASGGYPDWCRQVLSANNIQWL